MSNERHDADGLSFEQALVELEDLVAQLEEGNMPLEESMALFERGQLLAERCNTMLDAAEMRVYQIDPSSGDLSQLIPGQGEDDG